MDTANSGHACMAIWTGIHTYPKFIKVHMLQPLSALILFITKTKCSRVN